MYSASPQTTRADDAALKPELHAARPAADTGLTVRQLKIDLSKGFARHWHGGDAFKSQHFNALSMSFPSGEQSFIDAVRECVELLPRMPDNEALHDTVAQFIGQEATHRHIHARYNAELAKQGLINGWEQRIAARLAFGHKRSIKPIHLLAITAAYEHLTAVLSDYLLRIDHVMAGADPAMRTLWRWHAAEETEHRAVAFELYQAMGGNYRWRLRWFIYALVLFMADSGRQTVNNLWHDGTLFKPATWWSAARFYWGRNGMIWNCTGPLLAYFRRDFHPDQEARRDPREHAKTLAQDWLKNNAGRFRVVR